MIIAIVGKGYIGKALAAHWGDSAIFVPGHLNTFAECREVLARLKPDVVVNTALKGSPTSIQALEEGSAAWNDHLQVNVLLPEWLGLLTTELGFRLVHISTLMMMDDWCAEPEPSRFGHDEGLYTYASGDHLSKYAWMKLLAEHRLCNSEGRVAVEPYSILIPRIHLPFSGSHDPRNFFSRLPGWDSYVTDTVSMTNLEDFAILLDRLIAQEAEGIINCVNDGLISAYDIAHEMSAAGLMPPDKILMPTTLEQWNRAHPEAPYQPRIVAHSIRRKGREQMPPIKVAVERAIHQLKAG